MAKSIGGAVEDVKSITKNKADSNSTAVEEGSQAWADITFASR